MDRTFVGNLEQARPLLRIERPGEHNSPLDAVDHPFLGFAGFAVGGMDLGVAETDRDPIERQCLALGIEP